MRRAGAVFGVLAAAVLLSACAAREQLAVQRGGELVAAGEPALTASRVFLNKVEATSLKAQVELAVVDRSCDWPGPRIPADTRQTRHPDQQGKLCSVGSAERAARLEAAGSGPPFREPILFRPVGARELEPTIRLIGGMVAYLDAVDGVVTADPDSSGAQLALALTDAQNVVGIAELLSGDQERDLLTKQQADAATGLVGLIGEFVQVKGQASALEAQVRKDGPAFDRNLGLLQASLDQWSKLVLASDLDTIDSVFQLRMRKLRPNADDSAYRSFLGEWQQLTVDRTAAARGVPAALAQALAATGEAHRQYVNILTDRTLTPENRRAKAEIARQQFSRTLQAVANLLRAFS